jgi:integrase
LSAAYLVLLMMGLRRGELLGVRWQDIDWKTHVLCVKQTLVRVRRFLLSVEEEKGSSKTQLVTQEPKTERSRRTLPVPEACLAALRHHRARQAEEKLALGPAYQDHDLVFCRPDGGPIDPRTLNRAFHRVLAQAGLPRIKLHSTRHTYATWLLEQGESPRVVQELLGHSSVAITLDLYSHVSLELEKKAAATLNAALAGRLQ